MKKILSLLLSVFIIILFVGCTTIEYVDKEVIVEKEVITYVLKDTEMSTILEFLQFNNWNEIQEGGDMADGDRLVKISDTQIGWRADSSVSVSDTLLTKSGSDINWQASAAIRNVLTKDVIGNIGWRPKSFTQPFSMYFNYGQSNSASKIYKFDLNTNKLETLETYQTGLTASSLSSMGYDAINNRIIGMWQINHSAPNLRRIPLPVQVFPNGNGDKVSWTGLSVPGASAPTTLTGNNGIIPVRNGNAFFSMTAQGADYTHCFKVNTNSGACNRLQLPYVGVGSNKMTNQEIRLAWNKYALVWDVINTPRTLIRIDMDEFTASALSIPFNGGNHIFDESNGKVYFMRANDTTVNVYDIATHSLSTLVISRTLSAVGGGFATNDNIYMTEAALGSGTTPRNAALIKISLSNGQVSSVTTIAAPIISSSVKQIDNVFYAICLSGTISSSIFRMSIIKFDALTDKYTELHDTGNINPETYNIGWYYIGRATLLVPN